MRHVIKGFSRVLPNWFLSIWYIPCKPCTYIASRLALSLNRPNRASTWASSPRTTIGCFQNGFLSLWCIRCKLCTHLASRLALSPNRSNWVPLEPFHLGVPWVLPKQFLSLWCIRRKTCTYLAQKLTLSQNRPKGDSIWHRSFRSFIGCVQIDFGSYGMLHANRGPILHQD